MNTCHKFWWKVDNTIDIYRWIQLIRCRNNCPAPSLVPVLYMSHSVLTRTKFYCGLMMIYCPGLSLVPVKCCSTECCSAESCRLGAVRLSVVRRSLVGCVFFHKCHSTECCVFRLSVVRMNVVQLGVARLSVGVLRQLSRNIKRLWGERRCLFVLRDAAP